MVEHLRHRLRISLRDPRANQPGSLVHSVLGSERFIAALLEEFDPRDYFRQGSELREGLNQEPFEAIVDPLREALLRAEDDAGLAMLKKVMASRGMPPESTMYRPDQ